MAGNYCHGENSLNWEREPVEMLCVRPLIMQDNRWVACKMLRTSIPYVKFPYQAFESSCALNTYYNITIIEEAWTRLD